MFIFEELGRFITRSRLGAFCCGSFVDSSAVFGTLLCKLCVSAGLGGSSGGSDCLFFVVECDISDNIIRHLPSLPYEADIWLSLFAVWPCWDIKIFGWID